MNQRLQIIIVLFLLVVLVVLVNMIRKHKLELRYALSWLMVDLVTLCLALVPSIIQKIAALLGVISAMNMLFFAGFLFSLLLIFILTVTVSEMSLQIKSLTQQMALMEKRLSERGLSGVNDQEEK